MTVEEHQAALKAWLDQPPEGDVRGIDEALYAFSERNLWPDNIDSISPAQATMCWALVERVRKYGFPKELRM